MDLKLQYDKLLRYCYHKTKSEDLAEDIVQETFLKFWQSHSYEDTGKELAYLFRMKLPKSLRHIPTGMPT